MNIKSEVRDKNIQLRVTDKEKSEIAKKAAERGLSIAAYVRTAALRAF